MSQKSRLLNEIEKHFNLNKKQSQVMLRVMQQFVTSIEQSTALEAKAALSHGHKVGDIEGLGGMATIDDAEGTGNWVRDGSGNWVAITIPTVDVEEAPQDGGYYCRRNGVWVEVSVTPV